MRNLSYENVFCMQFHFNANQSHFHENGAALRLALKQRHKGTRKWPIMYIGLRGAHVFLFCRFSCAAKRNVDKDTAQFDFDRSSCPWNGETIKKKLQGNSALYILEDDQVRIN